jgi:PhzF family phenazine biosynthesis protein
MIERKRVLAYKNLTGSLMQQLTLYQIDAFAENLFEGNPAAVIPLREWLTDELMQNLAAENNLSETAFFVAAKEGYHIRWFTPCYEVDLCGHATLASAFVIFNHLGFSGKAINFQSKSGLLKVEKKGNQYELDFPVQKVTVCDTTAEIINTFGKSPKQSFEAEDYLLVFDDEDFVRSVTPDFEAIRKLDKRAVIITARSKSYDFVSRFFIPEYGINEDPVTGSSFTSLAPYWASVLNKKKFKARQVSARGGNVNCELVGDRVKISGTAVDYMKGVITIP